jgi:hypothetical protein
VSECNHKVKIMRGPWPTGCCCARRKKLIYDLRSSKAGSVQRNKDPYSASRLALKGQDRDFFFRNDVV